MHIKFKPRWIITSFVAGYVLYIIVLSLLGLPNPFYKSDTDDIGGYDTLLKPFDPIIPDSVSHAKYLNLKDSIKTMRELKNGEYLGGGGWYFSGVLGTTDGLECDTCTLWWIKNVYLRNRNDKPLKSQDYLMLLSWKVNNKVEPDAFWTTDSVQFYVEHHQAYIRKFVRFGSLQKKKYRDYHVIDWPVKFRYSMWEHCVMIPVSKTVKHVMDIILGGLTLLLICYIFILIGDFFGFLLDVSKGYTFTDVNMRRLKRISYSLLSIPFILLAVNLLLRVIFIPYLTSDVVLNIDTLNAYWKLLAIGVISLMIYLSFRQGKKLKDEQEFTI